MVDDYVATWLSNNASEQSTHPSSYKHLCQAWLKHRSSSCFVEALLCAMWALPPMLEPRTEYDHNRQRMMQRHKFCDPSLESLQAQIRFRALTTEQAEHLKAHGNFRQVPLPTGECENWDKVSLLKICAALRLTSHGDRHEIGEEAVCVGLMPESLLKYCGQNEHDEPMPVPLWISSGNMTSAGKLTAGFCGRTWPFRIGSLVLLIWKDDRTQETVDAEFIELSKYIREICSEYHFKPSLAETWVFQMKFWRELLGERHHESLNVQDLVAQESAVVVRLDMDNGANDTGVDLDAYAALAQCAYTKQDSVAFYIALWKAIMHQVNCQLPGGELKTSLLAIAKVSAMNDIECKLFEESENKWKKQRYYEDKQTQTAADSAVVEGKRGQGLPCLMPWLPSC